MNLELVKVDYTDDQQSKDLVYLLNAYAQDPMGGGQPLPNYVQENLVHELSKLSFAISFICYAEGQPVGLVNCMEGFSSFACKPLINIHDIVVLSDYRGKGISQLLLQKVDELAKEKGCCKVTLEVLSGNEVAKQAYMKHGFAGYELDPEKGHALFWHKAI